jgi:Lipase (class 3)
MTPSVPTLLAIGDGVQLCYAPDFITTGKIDPTALTALGFELQGLLSATERFLWHTSYVWYGVKVRDINTGRIHYFQHGTADDDEWWEDFEAEHVQCPFLPQGYLSHRGFTGVMMGLMVTPSFGGPVISLSDDVAELDLPPAFHGHSLAGATMTLAAVAYGAEDLTHTLWAAPRVFSPGAADYVTANFKRNLLRIVNPNGDLVPCAPPENLGWKHVGETLLISPPVKADPKCAHILVNYLCGVSLLDPTVAARLPDPSCVIT